jgi:hypothetical protein
LAAETNGHTLSGEVEVDGAYFGGHVRPANKAEDRVDRRLAENQTGKRRVVVAIRQRKGRTLSFVVRQEADGVALVRAKVAADARVHADEASHWDGLQRGLQPQWRLHEPSGVLFLTSAPHGAGPASSRQRPPSAPVRRSCGLDGRSPPFGQRRAHASCAASGAGALGKPELERVLATRREVRATRRH